MNRSSFIPFQYRLLISCSDGTIIKDGEIVSAASATHLSQTTGRLFLSIVMSS